MYAQRGAESVNTSAPAARGLPDHAVLIPIVDYNGVVGPMTLVYHCADPLAGLAADNVAKMHIPMYTSGAQHCNVWIAGPSVSKDSVIKMHYKEVFVPYMRARRGSLTAMGIAAESLKAVVSQDGGNYNALIQLVTPTTLLIHTLIIQVLRTTKQIITKVMGYSLIR